MNRSEVGGRIADRVARSDSPAVWFPPRLLYALAFALFLNTWWVVVLLVPALLAVLRFVIVPEEKYLRRRFGADYEAYTRRVRRWL